MKEILFIYNADSGIVNALFDNLHKVFKPSTYDCHLCSITYGKFRMRKEWEEFIKALPVKSVFLHKDEFRAAYPENGNALPAIFIKENEIITLAIAANSLQLITLQELMLRVRLIIE